MTKIDFMKRLGVLALASLSLFIQIFIFGLLWYQEYADYIQVYFYERGHWLVISIYGIMLFFCYHMYGAFKIGYLRTGEVLFSQIFGTSCATILAYAQISLLIGWLVSPIPLLITMILDVIVCCVCTCLGHSFYRMVYPPKKLILIHGNRDIRGIQYKFDMRKDKYDIVKSMDITQGFESIIKEVENQYDGIIIWDIPNEDRNRLIKYCYTNSIRVYTMPKITDIIVRGSEQLHLFDTPILLTREYSLTVGQRIIKRVIDLICSILLCVITLPITLTTAVIIRLYDGGPVFYKQTRCTKGLKEFSIYKFRSMKVDAEKDGVARLATQNDSRITPIGKFIRMVRIDELPQLFNIIKGDMTFIGPRPERPEIITKYMEEIPEFGLRTKVKAGLAGYAQVYGKYNTTPYDKLKLDLVYILNYSTWLDLKLMLLTLKILFSPESTEGVSEADILDVEQPTKKECK